MKSQLAELFTHDCLALQVHVPESQFDTWSPLRQKAWKRRFKSPARYFYRFLHPQMSPAPQPRFTLREHSMFLAAIHRFSAPYEWGAISLLIPGRVGAQCRRYFKLLRSADFIESTGTLKPIPYPRAHSEAMTSASPVFLRRTLRKFFPTRLPYVNDALVRPATPGLSRKRSLSTSPARRSRKRRLGDIPLNSPSSIDTSTLCRFADRSVPCRLRISFGEKSSGVKTTSEKATFNTSHNAFHHSSQKCAPPVGYVASEASTIPHDSSFHSELDSSLLSNAACDRKNYIFSGKDKSTVPPHGSANHATTRNLEHNNENLQNNIGSNEASPCISEIADALMLLASNTPQSKNIEPEPSPSKSRMSISFLIDSSDSSHDRETPVPPFNGSTQPPSCDPHPVTKALLTETDNHQHMKKDESHKSVFPTPVTNEAARPSPPQSPEHLVETIDVSKSAASSLNHFPSARKVVQMRELLRIFCDDAAHSPFITHQRERSILLHSFDDRLLRISELYDTINSDKDGHKYHRIFEVDNACGSLIESFINQLAEMEQRQARECEVKSLLHQVMVC